MARQDGALRARGRDMSSPLPPLLPSSISSPTASLSPPSTPSSPSSPRPSIPALALWSLTPPLVAMLPSTPASIPPAPWICAWLLADPDKVLCPPLQISTLLTLVTSFRNHGSSMIVMKFMITNDKHIYTCTVCTVCLVPDTASYIRG
jgi:hypothetical protein